MEQINFPLKLHKDPIVRSQQFEAMVTNLTGIHETLQNTNPGILASESQWFDKGHDISSKLAGGDVVRGAGIVAALSPENEWGRNVQLAQDFFRTGGVEGAHKYSIQTDKAHRILQGEHPLDVLGGAKESSFFQNLLDPNNPQPVTIDRHAHDLAIGQKVGAASRGLSGKPFKPTARYTEFANAYRTAASRLDIPVPSRLQAALWGAHVRGLTGVN